MAAACLVELGYVDDDTIDLLLSAWTSRELMFLAARPFSTLLAASPAAAVQLIALSRTATGRVSLQVLKCVHTTSPELVDALFELLEQPDPHQASLAANTLIRMAARDQTLLVRLEVFLATCSDLPFKAVLSAFMTDALCPPGVAALLVARLDDPDQGRRDHAVSMIGGLAGRGVGDLYLLEHGVIASLLRTDNGLGTLKASHLANALDALAPEGSEVLTALLSCLSSDDWYDRLQGVRGLAAQPRTDDPRVRPALLAALREPQSEVRRQAIAAFKRDIALGSVIAEAVAARIHDEDLTVRLDAAAVLAALDATAFISLAAQALRGQIREAEFDTALFVAQLAVAIPDALSSPALLDAVLDALATGRWELMLPAIRIITALPNIDPRLVPALVVAFDNPDASVRRCSLMALPALHVVASVPSELLAARLTDPQHAVRLAAASALRHHPGPTVEALDVVLDVLRQSDWSLRRTAVQTLLDLYRWNPVPPHMTWDEDSSPWLVTGIDWIGPDRAVALGTAPLAVVLALLTCLRDETLQVRLWSVVALVWLDVLTPSLAADLLLDELRRPVPRSYEDYERTGHLPDHREVAVTLGWLGIARADVLTALRDLLDGGDPRARVGAAAALGMLGHKDPASRQALRGCLRDTVRWVRLHAAVSLLQLGEADPAVLTTLHHCQRQDAYARAVATRALAQYGNPLLHGGSRRTPQ